jgi:predicted HD superfamily hydrolase involved in NAD metabolism
MTFEQIQNQIKASLNPSRYLHSLGVKEVACDMAVIFGYDEEKAGISGILHDCAKCLSAEELLANCEKYHLSVSETEEKCPFLLHAKVGAAFAKDYYGVSDEEILSAITYHTTGRPAMTLPEKIIFTADYIEPSRKPLPRIQDIREAAYSDLDLAVYMVLENMLHYLKESNDVIDTITVDTYRYYKAAIESR